MLEISLPAELITALAETLARECDYPATNSDRSFPAVVLVYQITPSAETAGAGLRISENNAHGRCS